MVSLIVCGCVLLGILIHFLMLSQLFNPGINPVGHHVLLSLDTIKLNLLKLYLMNIDLQFSYNVFA
jgi:hypothetical protein